MRFVAHRANKELRALCAENKRLQAEVDRLNDEQHAYGYAEIQLLRAENERLKKALAPFAAANDGSVRPTSFYDSCVARDALQGESE